MAIDPVTLALLSAVGGATAKKFVDDAWDLGKGWLDDYFVKHQPEAKENAQENALDFLVELGNRIQKLEEKAEDSSIINEQIKSSLSDPDFSVLLQNALISSARTSSREKHNLMALVVSDRLIAYQESVKMLTSNMVIDVIPHLSPKHLKLLGLMTAVQWHLLPLIPSKTIDKTFWIDHLVKSLSPLLPEEEITEMDYMHLESVSCITITQGRNINPLISPPKELSIVWSNYRDGRIFLKETDVGKKLLKIWVGGLEKSYLTSLGGLIGIYVQDELREFRIDLMDKYGVFDFYNRY